MLANTQKATPAPPPLLRTNQASPAMPTAPPNTVKSKRIPVKRSREDEKLAYRRMFLGCGQQNDYDIMTKLGEGTFGSVPDLYKYLLVLTGLTLSL